MYCTSHNCINRFQCVKWLTYNYKVFGRVSKMIDDERCIGEDFKMFESKAE